jgi:hypothetical protein
MPTTGNAASPATTATTAGSEATGLVQAFLFLTWDPVQLRLSGCAVLQQRLLPDGALSEGSPAAAVHLLPSPWAASGCSVAAYQSAEAQHANDALEGQLLHDFCSCLQSGLEAAVRAAPSRVHLYFTNKSQARCLLARLHLLAATLPVPGLGPQLQEQAMWLHTLLGSNAVFHHPKTAPCEQRMVSFLELEAGR